MRSVTVASLIAVALSVKPTQATLLIPINGIGTASTVKCYHHILIDISHISVYKTLVI